MQRGKATYGRENPTGKREGSEPAWKAKVSRVSDFLGAPSLIPALHFGPTVNTKRGFGAGGHKDRRPGRARGFAAPITERRFERLTRDASLATLTKRSHAQK